MLCVLLLVPWQCHTSMQRRNLLTTECGFHDFVLLPENTASEPLKRTLSPMLADHLEPAMGLTRVGVPSALPELKFTHDLLIQPLNARTSAMSPTASAPSKDFHSRCFEVGWAHYTAPLIPVLGTCLVSLIFEPPFVRLRTKEEHHPLPLQAAFRQLSIEDVGRCDPTMPSAHMQLLHHCIKLGLPFVNAVFRLRRLQASLDGNC